MVLLEGGGASHDHRQPLYDRASASAESRSPMGGGEAPTENSFWLGDADRPMGPNEGVIGKGNRSQEASEEAGRPFE